MKQGVIVAMGVDAIGERLVLIDGSEFAVASALAPPSLAKGTMVKIICEIVDERKIPLAVTVLPDDVRA